MSTRFYAGPVSSGMGRRWDDWVEPESAITAQLRRWRASLSRPDPASVTRPAPPPETRHPLVEPSTRQR